MNRITDDLYDAIQLAKGVDPEVMLLFERVLQSLRKIEQFCILLAASESGRDGPNA